MRASRDGKGLEFCRVAEGSCALVTLRHPGPLEGIGGTGIVTPSLTFRHPHYGESSTFTFFFHPLGSPGGQVTWYNPPTFDLEAQKG